MSDLKDLRPAVLFVSASNSILDEKINGIKNSFKDILNPDSDIKIFYCGEGIDESEFLNFYNTPSFFSEKKIAILKNIEKLSSEQIRMIIKIVEDVDIKNYGTALIMGSLKDLSAKREPEKSLLDSLKKKGSIEKITAPQTGSLRKWLEEKSELDGIRFTSKASLRLIENVNFDLDLLRMEYEKIFTYMISEREKVIDEKIVEKLVYRVYDMKIFDLIDCIGNRDKKNALKVLKAIRLEKENIPGIITLLHRMFKAMLYIKAGNVKKRNDMPGGQSARSYIMRNLGHLPYMIPRLLANYTRFARKYSTEEIIKIFDVLSRYDIGFRAADFKEYNLTLKMINEIINL